MAITEDLWEVWTQNINVDSTKVEYLVQPEACLLTFKINRATRKPDWDTIRYDGKDRIALESENDQLTQDDLLEGIRPVYWNWVQLMAELIWEKSLYTISRSW